MTTDQINQEIFNSEHMENIDTNDISDGCHTFGQLYFQRMMLFATLVNLFPEISWKTKRHEDGEECFGGGWFLVTIDTPEGAYGYHYRLEDWDKFNCMELYRAKHWDGYTEDNVDRLLSLVDYKKYMQKLNRDFTGYLLKNAERQKMFNILRESKPLEGNIDD